MNMTNQTSNKRSILFCEPCSFKKIIESDEDAATLVECKTSPVQLHLPTLDPTTLKPVVSKFQPQAKRYKCPKCGRVAKVRELFKPFQELLKAADQQKAKDTLEEEKRKRFEDGKPPEKKIDPDFLG
jgi:transposase